jgi:hypothetical protein
MLFGREADQVEIKIEKGLYFEFADKLPDDIPDVSEWTKVYGEAELKSDTFGLKKLQYALYVNPQLGSYGVIRFRAFAKNEKDEWELGSMREILVASRFIYGQNTEYSRYFELPSHKELWDNDASFVELKDDGGPDFKFTNKLHKLPEDTPNILDWTKFQLEEITEKPDGGLEKIQYEIYIDPESKLCRALRFRLLGKDKKSKGKLDRVQEVLVISRHAYEPKLERDRYFALITITGWKKFLHGGEKWYEVDHKNQYYADVVRKFLEISALIEGRTKWQEVLPGDKRYVEIDRELVEVLMIHRFVRLKQNQ